MYGHSNYLPVDGTIEPTLFFSRSQKTFIECLILNRFLDLHLIVSSFSYVSLFYKL